MTTAVVMTHETGHENDYVYLALDTNEVLSNITDLQTTANDWAVRACTEFLDRYLKLHVDRLRSARDHLVGIQRDAVGHGLYVVETCFAPPCPWFGQHKEDTMRPERTLFHAWVVTS